MKLARCLWLRLMLVSLLLVAGFAGSAEAATVSGTVTNNSGIAGRVYLSGQWSNGGNAGWGISVEVGSTGTVTYAIRGVQDGTYIINAFIDTQNSGMQHANDPVGTSAVFNVTGGADAPNVGVTLNNPSAVGLQPPTAVNVIPGDLGVLVTWDAATDTNGREIATSYKVYWSTSASPGPGNMTGSSPTIPSNDNYIKDFTNGIVLYFAVTATLDGVESAPRNANGGAPVTIGAPAGGVTVSGTVSTTGAALGATPLYIALGGGNGPPSYIARIAAPSAGQAYTIPGVQPGSYGIYAIIDMNNNGVIDLGDIGNTEGNGVPVTVAGASVTSADVSLVAANAQVAVKTNHYRQGGNESYGVSFEVFEQMKRPVNVSVSGPQVAIMDMGLSSRGGFEAWPGVPNRPTLLPPDTYSFDISYSDGTNTGGTPLTAPVTGIVDSFATPVSPVGYVPYPVISPASFTWTPPLSPPSPHIYSFWLSVPNFNDSNTNNMPNNTTSIDYPYNFLEDHQYQWNIAVKDGLGNSAQSQVNFAPTTRPAITSFTPTAGIPGTQVTISGFNFGATPADNTVSFNGTTAPIISASSSQLVVTVPAAASTGEIVINNLTTQKNTGSIFPNQFTVITPTPPTTTANPSGGPQTGPINVFLTTNEPGTIYYTTNGIDPTIASASFTDTVGNVAKGPIAISANTVLKYFAMDLQGASETIKQQVYTFGATTTLSLGLSSGSIVYGDTVTATATITSGAAPTPIGTVQFFLDGSPVGSLVPLSGTTASRFMFGFQVTGSPHTISAVYSGDSTHAPSSGSAQLTVARANQMITVNSAAPVSAVFDNTFIVGASADSGLPVTYSSGSPTVCTNVDSTFTMVSGTGTCVVQYDQAGNNNYAAAPQLISNTGAIKATATVTLGSLSQTYTGSPLSASAATNPVGLTVTLTYNGSATVPNNAGSYAVVGTINDSNFEGSANASLTIEAKLLTISGITAANKTYDGTTTATLNGTATLLGVVGTDDVALNSSAVGSFDTKNVGTGKTVSVSGLTLTGTKAANYSITGTASTTANITAATLTVSAAAAASKVYDGTTTASLTSFGALTGVITADIGKVVLTGPSTGTFSDANAGIAKTVTINGLGLSGMEAGNYVLASTSTTATADISKANQTITFTPSILTDKIVGDAPFSVTASANTGLPVTVSIVSGPATYAAPLLTLGVAPVDPTSATDYTVTVRAFQPGDANRNSAATTITFRLWNYGDMNQDGSVSITDAYNYLLMSLKLSSPPAFTGNLLLAPIVAGKPAAIPGSRSVNILDVRAILERLVGLW